MKRIALLFLAASALVGCSSDDDGCDGYFDDMTMSFEGFDEHVGQLFEIKTEKWGDTVGAVVVTAIPAPEFSVTLEAYCGSNRVEFYADANDNGQYDPPPEDHAWRITVATEAEVINGVVFQHDTNFVDIGW